MRVKTLSNENCKSRVDKPWQAQLVCDQTLCTLAPRMAGVDREDRGSPLVAKGQLIGVASWSAGAGMPDAFKRISSHIKWIEEVSTDDIE